MCLSVHDLRETDRQTDRERERLSVLCHRRNVSFRRLHACFHTGSAATQARISCCARTRDSCDGCVPRFALPLFAGAGADAEEEEEEEEEMVEEGGGGGGDEDSL